MPGWPQGDDGFGDEHPSSGAVHVREAGFCCEWDEEPLPALLVRSHSAEPMLPQSLGVPPRSDLVERPSISEDDDCIQAARSREVDAQPLFKAVIVWCACG